MVAKACDRVVSMPVSRTGFWLAGNEGMEKKMGHTGTTIPKPYNDSYRDCYKDPFFHS